MRSTYKILEYGSFYTGDKDKGMSNCTFLPPSTFVQLENFILTNKNKDSDALELMGLSAKKGIGKIITVKNYVGIITMNDGTTIEILPKIYSRQAENEKCTKKLLVDMLKTLRSQPYKSLQSANVNIEKMNLFEVFIRMFLDELFFITKRGLKRSYETIRDNCQIFKGKMKFAEQLKYNQIHKERCYVEYDEFNVNRPENKLIKSTLLYLNKQSLSSKNKADIKILLNFFEKVDGSIDYSGDFSKYVPDRDMKDYTLALMWSKVFLMGKSFTSFSGRSVACALLFPMDALFESYIAVQLKKALSVAEYSVSVQDKSHHLFDWPCKKFLMKPDLVVKRKRDNTVFILDTKWKILSGSKSNYGISQADMYQMYAYQKKYQSQNTILLYPQTDKISEEETIEFLSVDGAAVSVKLVDLFDIQKSVQAIASLLSD